MQKTNLILILISFLTLLTPIRAEVVLDGTLGRSGALPGPDYLIGADLGQQRGGNLFHSFQYFNLDRYDSATFSGPNSVQNLISRVTGGKSSRIFGTLRSTIPDADFYFLNPHGILFGEGASLDVQGSFHASTADTLRFSDGKEFNARYPNDSLLTVAPIKSFGFLTDAPSAISIEDTKLSVPEGETLSLIGGNLRMNGNPPYKNDKGTTMFDMNLKAPFGRINLASVASKGEIMPTDLDLIVSEKAQGGRITLNNTLINTSGEGGGAIYIRGGQFELANSQILGETLGDEDGGVIDVQTDNLTLKNSLSSKISTISTLTQGNGKGGDIFLKVADTLLLSNSKILANTTSEPEIIKEGNAGNIEIGASKIIFQNGAVIQSATKGSGKSGTIVITGNNLTLIGGSKISNTTFGPGKGGIISIKVNDTFTISDVIINKDGKQQQSGVVSNSLGKENNAGDGGNIFVEASEITVKNGAQINVRTKGTGNAGTVNIIADMLTISERIIFKNKEDGKVKFAESGIFGHSQTTQIDAGNAATIKIKASEIMLKNGAVIQSATTSSGNSGNVDITTDNLTLIGGSKISNTTFGPGEGGTISIKVNDTFAISDTIINKDGKQQSGVVSDSGNQDTMNAGNAGKINIQASQMTLSDQATIRASTYGTGEAGSLLITVTDSLTISNDGKILTNSFGNEEKTGNAGKIEIDASKIIFQNGAVIQSATKGSGKSGTIVITGNNLTLTGGSNISNTTFGLGEGGTIIIKVNDMFTASGFSIKNKEEPQTSGVISNSQGEDAGNGGNIFIEASKITINNGAQINARTNGSGNAGTINIIADTLAISDKIIVKKDKKTEFVESGIFGHSQTTKTNAGNAAAIKISASQIILKDEGTIATQANNSAGGNITLTALNLLYLQNGNVTTDVKGGDGDGGNITIQKPVFVVLDGAQIITKARRGSGGNIMIDSLQFLSSADKNNVLDASSDKLKNYGKIFITAPEEDISGSLIILSTTPLNTDDLQKKRCEGLTKKDLNKLIVIDRDVPPITPDDQKTHYIRRPNAPKPVKPPYSSVAPEQLF